MTFAEIVDEMNNGRADVGLLVEWIGEASEDEALSDPDFRDQAGQAIYAYQVRIGEL